VSALPRSAAPTLDQREHAIAAEVRCPSCSALTAADSNASTAVAVRNAIRQQLVAGKSREQIESFLAGRYGPDILLRPTSRGLTGLVWVLPVAAALLVLAGLALALRRWCRPAAALGDTDRQLVDEALATSSASGPARA
jgi:cytochrome c-type biogenesis protein CcmH